jgi:dolichol-phosphate mannosyltransferase
VISVIIPCKNEPYLPTLLHDLSLSLTLPYETRIQTEQGLGNAVLCGVRSSVGDAVAILDADGSHHPKYISNMVKLLEKYDIVIGSRYVRGGATEDYFLRMLLSRLYCKVAKFLFNLKVNDNMSGFVVAKREVFNALTLKPVGYKFGLEMLIKSRGKFRVCEYPVRFEKRKMGLSKTGFGQALKTFAFILQLRLTA